jgi:hypothetical protein
MTQEHKDLLLKDLCARLPYGVKFACNKNIYTAKGLDLIVTDEGDWEYAVTAKGIAPIEIDFIKPYLFPLSSMTEEQLYNNPIGFSQMLTIKADRDWENITINRRAYYKLVDWFNKNHFDYRGLIPMELANDVTGLNIY